MSQAGVTTSKEKGINRLDAKQYLDARDSQLWGSFVDEKPGWWKWAILSDHSLQGDE